MQCPYWRAMATWYETLELGAPGGDVFRTITELLEGEAFASSLNPGHLIHYEEWLDSPDPRGLDRPDRERHGDPERHHPDGDPRRLDRELRGHRRDRRRRPASRDRVATSGAVVADHGPPRLHARPPGIDVRDEVLPLSPTPAYFPPFWLDLDRALAFA